MQVSIFKDEAADELIERRFEDEPDELGDFLRKYSGSRSEKGLKRSIISIYDEMRSIPIHELGRRKSEASGKR